MVADDECIDLSLHRDGRVWYGLRRERRERGVCRSVCVTHSVVADDECIDLRLHRDSRVSLLFLCISSVNISGSEGEIEGSL